MSGTEVFTNYAQTTAAGSSGTTAPATGTTETWTVASSASFPAASTVSGATFHIADPSLPGEVIQVTNVSGTTWTVIRGAESTTPVAHATGATFKQVVTAGVLSTFRDTSWANILSFGADPTGTNDSTSAINAALNSLPISGSPGVGGVVYFPAGTYKTTTTITCNAVAPVYFMGDGPQVTRINYYGTGDCISMYNNYTPAGGPASILVWGGGVEGMTIDGTNATGTTMAGLHIGDMKYAAVRRVHIQNFSASGGVGLWQDNRMFWTEDCLFEVHVIGCPTAVLIDTHSTHTAHDNNVYDIGTSLANGNVNGVVLSGNSNCYHCRFHIHGGGQSSSTGTAGYWLLLGGDATNCFMNLCELYMQMESDGGGTVSQGLIKTVGTSSITAHGLLSYQNGANVTASSINAQFKFTGPIFGDNSLNALTASTTFNAATPMNKPPQLMIVTGGTVSAIKINGITTGLTSGCFFIPSGTTYEIDCTVNPTVTWIPISPQ